MKIGYYIVKFYNHEEKKVFYWNGNSFESFKSDPFVHDEIESTEPLIIYPSPSIEQEAEAYADREINKKNNVIYTGDEVHKEVKAAYIAGSNSKGVDGDKLKCDFHAAFTFCGDDGITYCSNCGNKV